MSNTPSGVWETSCTQLELPRITALPRVKGSTIPMLPESIWSKKHIVLPFLQVQEGKKCRLLNLSVILNSLKVWRLLYRWLLHLLYCRISYTLNKYWIMFGGECHTCRFRKQAIMIHFFDDCNIFHGQKIFQARINIVFPKPNNFSKN